MTVDTDLETTELDSQSEDLPEDSSTSQDDSPVEGRESAPVADDEAKKLRDRLANQGREIQEARSRASNAEALVSQQSQQLAALKDQIESIGGYISRQEASRREAYLNSLPADQRQAAEIKMLQREVESLRSGGGAHTPQQTAPQATPQAVETPEQYFERRSKEIVSEANEDFGVSLDVGSLDEILEDDDWKSEKAFRQAVRSAARATFQQGQRSPSKKEDTPVAKKQSEPEDMDARILRAVRQVTGVSGPNAARGAPAGGRNAPPSEQDYRRVTTEYDSKAGPKQTIQKLKELRTRTQRALRP